MSPNTDRRSWRLAAASTGLTLLSACQAESRLAVPEGPPADLAPHAFYLDIDIAQGTVRVVPPVSATASAGAANGLTYSLAGSELVGLTTSNFFRSAIGQFVANKRTITFDLTLTNKLSVTDLVTPTFPLPPNGTQGILAFPYTVAAYGVQGGKATPNTEWNGTGAAGSGAPFNFFNDFGGCTTAVTSDCYRWEMFPTPLKPGQTTAPQKVGFTVDKNVTNVGVYLVVAADLVDHPPPPPQPGLGALTGTVGSPPPAGGRAGVTVTLSPGGQTAVTDGVGKYLFTGLPVGPVTAAVSALPAGCPVPASQSVTISSGGVATADFSVSCQATTGAISGTATSPELGPFASATVQLLQSPALTLVTQTTTNAAGGFSFSAVTPGSYVVQIVGLQPPCPATGGPVGVTVTAGATATVTLSVSCVATGSGSIVGTVSWPAGALSESLSITSTASVPPATVMSDPFSGAYGPVSVAAGQVIVTLAAVPSGCTAPAAQAVAVGAGATVTVDFAVACPNANITGQLTSPTLGALAGATVSVTINGVTSGSVLTDAGGNFAGLFTWPGNGPGSVVLTVISGLPPSCAMPNASALTLPKGGSIAPHITVDCTGGSGNGTISGTVTSPQLGALALTVSAGAGGSTATATSDPFTGAYGPISIGAGQVQVSLTAVPAGCTLPPSQTASVTPGGSATVNFSVTCTSGSGNGSVVGTATSPEVGALASATVQLLQGTPLVLVTQTTTNSTGGFTFSGVVPGSYAVLVVGLTPPCPTTGGPVNVVVAAGATATADLSISCTGAGGNSGSISGTVTSPQLGPMAVTISATSAPGGATASGTSSASTGAYGPISIAAGQVTVSASGVPSGCTAPQSQTVTLAAGAAATVDFIVDCTGGNMLTGQVTSPTFGALGGVTVSIFSVAVSATTITDGAGDYSFPRSLCGVACSLDPLVRVTLPHGLPPFCATPAQIFATIPIPTGTAVVPFVVDCTFGAVTGAVTVVGTLPSGATTITLTNADPLFPVVNTTANAAGRYTFAAVPTGAALVAVSAAPGCSSSAVNITVPSGATVQQDLVVTCP